MTGLIITIIAVLTILAVLLYLYLNRNPIRTISPEKDVVSPADGRII